MSLINENFLKLQDSYLFSTIAKKVAKFTEENPEKEIIKLGIGDVTRPIVPACIEAMHKAVDEIGTKEGFKGYGPEQGYDFLRDAIVKNDYKSRGIDVKKDEIFVSDGAKCDCGNIVDIFGKENKVAITDPVYPVYLDTNIMSGRDVIYLPVTAKNNFMPELPKEKVDMIYLCFPNNPTGTVLTKEELKKASRNKRKRNIIVILFVLIALIVAYIMFRGTYLEIQELGEKYISVFWKNFTYTISIFVSNFVLLYIIFYITNNKIKKGLKKFFDEEKREMPKLINKSISFIMAIVISFCVTNIIKEKLMLFLNSASFEMNDPILGYDIGYFVFQKPFIEFVILYLLAIVIGITIYKVVKIICLTITRNAEVKAFGSSAEYTEFLKWRQEQGRQ